MNPKQVAFFSGRQLLPLFLLLFCLIGRLPAQESEPSSASANFPSGTIKGPYVWKSRIYPGTERNYWIYVPAQYSAARPACTMVVQDGLGRARGWGLTESLDSLIDRKELPVIIGIFVDHGKVAGNDADNFPRFNRSYEYDALGDRYARFLLEELIPEVKKSYNLSDNPDDRSIAGASSGAICAFNVAWERPDAFHRVLSTIGTYVGLRGGDEFATLVRKSEPKPLRVFLEDGNTDLNIYAGDWWMANQDMLSSLTWAGYEVEHIWGAEGHNSRGAKKIMPDALKWLWQGYPRPVSSHPDQYKGLQLTLPGQDWRVITTSDLEVERLAVGAGGILYFTDAHSRAVYNTGRDGQAAQLKKLAFAPGGLSLFADGRLYVADKEQHELVVFGENGSREVLLENVQADHLQISRKGIYFSDAAGARIGYYSFGTQQLSYVELAERPQGISLSAEQTFLNVAVGAGVLGYSFKITPEGHLAYGQTYIHYHIPYGKPTPAAEGIITDTENRTYTATEMGIQVADQLGRINFIFAKPGRKLTDLRLGGPDMDILYVVCDGRLYARKIQAKGLIPWQDAVKPPQPRL